MTWPGRDTGFSTKEQRQALKNGAPFAILAACSPFDEEDENGKTSIAYLVQLLNPAGFGPEGTPFVWTLKTSPSRLKLVTLLEKTQDALGPCQVSLIEQADKSRQPFIHIRSWYGQAVEDYIQPSDPEGDEPL